MNKIKSSKWMEKRILMKPQMFTDEHGSNTDHNLCLSVNICGFIYKIKLSFHLPDLNDNLYPVNPVYPV